MKSIRRLFNKVTSIGLLVTAAGCASAGVATPPQPPRINQLEDCITAGKPEFTRSPEKHRLLDLFNDASATLSSHALARQAIDREIRICFNPDLTQDVIDGRDSQFVTIGAYYVGTNMIHLNPDKMFNDTELTNTLVHELRHSVQHTAGYQFGNVPEGERIAYILFGEADARARAIHFAYEQSISGNGQYLRNMKTKSGYWPMVREFERSLKNNPGDISAALSAASREFFEMDFMVEEYSANIAAWIDRAGLRLDPALEVKNILDEETLRRMGDVIGGANYVDAAMMNTVRRAAIADYDDLLKFYRDNLQERENDHLRPFPITEPPQVVKPGGGF